MIIDIEDRFKALLQLVSLGLQHSGEGGGAIDTLRERSGGKEIVNVPMAAMREGGSWIFNRVIFSVECSVECGMRMRARLCDWDVHSRWPHIYDGFG